MGTTFLLIAARTDAELLSEAAREIATLERRWSRFLPDSEISILNRSNGTPVIVSAETFHVVQAAVDGATATDGRFDPTVHDAMLALGYGCTFDEMVEAEQPGPLAANAAPGVTGIEFDDAIHAVRLPPGVTLDLGGIGKGTAADIVSASVMRRGARGVAVSIGGDVRVRGESPSGSGWVFETGAPMAPFPPLDDGGVCTSSTGRRRWRTAHGDAHHIVDPRTGRSTVGPIASITVVGGSAQQAEVLTKAAIVAGRSAPELLDRFGVMSHIRWQTAA